MAIPSFLHLFPLLLLPISSQSPPLIASTSTAATTPLKLSSPLVGDDRLVYSCWGKALVAFRSNATLAWTLPLGYSCRTDAAPVTDGSGKIYLVAEDRILKVIPPNIATSKPAVVIFFGPESTFGGSGRIVGFCISIWSSSIFINIERRGIFSFSLRGQFLWSAGPLLYRLGYLQGCKENITDCYFSSAPSYDQCEGSLYISNNEGLLYSMYTRSPHFRWIQDFSSIDKLFVVTPGNNGRLYVTFPRRVILMALDVSTGNILWQNGIGPLSAEDNSPVVDSNGWVSIGSLDGYLYSFSPTGETTKFLKATAVDSVVHVSPVLDCSGFALYTSQTKMETKVSQTFGELTYISAMKPMSLLFTMLVPATGAVHWTGKYPGELSSLFFNTDLNSFSVDEKILLALLASSGTNNFSPFYTTRQKLRWTCSQAKPKHLNIYTGNERTILLFFLFQLVVIVMLAIFVRFCCIFWKKKKLQEHNLEKFIKKRRSLHMKRKACSKIISVLEQKVTKETVDHEVLEKLGDAVREKEVVEKKLSTTYSLGRDRTGSQQKSLLPLYDGRSRNYSYSFHSANKESVTIFNTLSDNSTSGEENRSNGSSNIDSGGSSGSRDNRGYDYNIGDNEMVTKGKAPIHEGPSGSGTRNSLESGDVIKSPETRYSVTANLLFSEPSVSRGMLLQSEREDGIVMESVKQGMSKRRMWLKRRRTMSSTN